MLRYVKIDTCKNDKQTKGQPTGSTYGVKKKKQPEK